ncbi:MAG TPA: hypothetical protein VGK20_08560 [Candidatus Binatia bacterium]|jgi:hypothetical protein
MNGRDTVRSRNDDSIFSCDRTRRIANSDESMKPFLQKSAHFAGKNAFFCVPSIRAHARTRYDVFIPG